MPAVARSGASSTAGCENAAAPEPRSYDRAPIESGVRPGRRRRPPATRRRNAAGRSTSAVAQRPPVVRRNAQYRRSRPSDAPRAQARPSRSSCPSSSPASRTDPRRRAPRTPIVRRPDTARPPAECGPRWVVQRRSRMASSRNLPLAAVSCHARRHIADRRLAPSIKVASSFAKLRRINPVSIPSA